MSDTTTSAVDGDDDGVFGVLVHADDLSSDELPDDEREKLEWLTTGGIRTRIRGEWYRLRRPSMGELRKLHEALEEQRDQSAEHIEQLKVESRKLAAEVQEAGRDLGAVLQEAAGVRDDDERAVELSAQVHELTARLAAVGRRQSRAISSSQLRAWEMGEQWWTEVFKLLRPKGQTVPRHLPSWVANTELPAQAIEHWMRVPLGRGGRHPGR